MTASRQTLAIAYTRRSFLQRSALASLAVAGGSALLSACGSDGEEPSDSKFSSPPAESDVTGTAVYLNYPGWIGSDNIAEFSKKYPEAKIKQTAAGFESLSGVAATVAQNPKAYDMLLASGDIAEQLEAGNFVLPIDAESVPQLEAVNPKIRELFPWGMPIDTGVIGIGYRKDLVSETIETWADFWEVVPKYSGKVVIVGVDRSALGSALIYKGYDGNSSDADELAEATDALLELKPHVQAFKVANIAQSLLDGSAAITMGYHYETAAAASKNADIVFVAPPEGVVGYIEGIVGVSQTDAPEVTLAFLNFMMEPENYANFVNTTSAARTSDAADDLIEEHLLTPAFDFPDNVQVFKFLGSDGTKAFSRAWSEVQAG
jgi:spermidine/putrescine-binding protein